MQIPKPSEADKEFFRSLVPDDPRVEVKPMFGNLGGFVNGNMFMGLFGADVGVKLDDAGAKKLLAEKGAGPFGPAERPMGGYVTLPAAWCGTQAARATGPPPAARRAGRGAPRRQRGRATPPASEPPRHRRRTTSRSTSPPARWRASCAPAASRRRPRRRRTRRGRTRPTGTPR